MGIKITLVVLSFALYGCALGGLDLTDKRHITIKKGDVQVDIGGDIESILDYPELHRIMKRMGINADQDQPTAKTL